MDQTGPAKGYAPFSPLLSSYLIYRNVVTGYGAASDGSGDQSGAINKAISDDNNGGSRQGHGVTIQPAEVFIPSGTYAISNPIYLLMNTIVMGDPNDPPVLKASPGFTASTFLNGTDGSAVPEDRFFTQLRNVILDLTALDGSTSITALQWGVAQGCALGNVQIKMPFSSTGMTGINIDGGSTTAVTDIQISGGVVGIQNSNQQVIFKNILFDGCTTGYAPTGGFTSLLQNVTFDTCGFGVDMTKGGTPGDLVLLDAVSTNSGDTLVYHDSSNDSGNRNYQIVIENLKHDTNNPIAVSSTGETTLAAQSFVDTWVWGNADPGNYVTGMFYETSRPSALLNTDGNFFTMDAPTYAGYSVNEVVNVKNVAAYPVQGDAKVDDSASLNAILAQNAANCKIRLVWNHYPQAFTLIKA